MISILLPVKNEASYINECLDSIHAQSIAEWELIIIDDHSTDSTTSQITEHKIYKSKKVKLIANSGNGVIDAIKTGLMIVSGEYITRMDGDDLMSRDRLQVMYEAMQKAIKPSIVCGQVEYFPEQNVSNGYREYGKWLNEVQKNQSHHKWMYRECVFASPNWMMKTSDLLDIGGFDKLTYPEDYAHALNCYEKGIEFIGIPHVTLQWRHHPHRTSLLDNAYSQSSFFELKISHWIKMHLDKSRNVLIWGKNRKSKLTSEILEKKQVEHICLDLSNVAETRSYARPLILIAVYPSKPEREKIRAYLNKMANYPLVEGTDYWFL